MKHKSGIYTITSPSGKKYIGQAVNIRNRWSQHRYDLRNNKHPNAALQAAFNKYGLQGLTFAVVETCTVENLDTAETRYLRESEWSSIYNIRKTVGMRGRPPGKPLSPEQKERLRKACTGRVKSEAERALIGAAHKGKSVSAETRAKLSLSIKGRRTPMERKERISAARNTSGERNVTFIARLSKWSAIAQVAGERFYLGYYSSLEAAVAARDTIEHAAETSSIKELQHLAKRITPAKATGASGIKGVSLNKATGRWIAYVRNGKTRQYLGSFSDVAAAAAAVAAATISP